MKIGNNASSLQAYTALARSGKNMLAASAHLSTGTKISSASENSAGMAISSKMRNQVQGLEKAGQSASNAISLIQTAEGSLNEIHAMIQRIREIGVQVTNDTNSDDDRALMQTEVNQLLEEVDKMIGNTEYNQMKLLNGGYGSDGMTLKFQVGANKNLNMKVELPELSAELLGLHDFDAFGDPIPLDTVSNPTRLITAADEALSKVSTLRSNLGAYQNRLEHTINYLDIAQTNTSSSLSRIFDTDVAAEMAEYSRLSVLTQTATSIMSQANQSPQSILQLLQ